MTTVFCDANVVIKWFHPAGEPQAAEALALALSTRERSVELRLLDLTYYEVGNVLLRKKRIAGIDTAAILRWIPSIAGAPVRPTPAEMDLAAELAHSFQLTFYDAVYWAAAQSESAELATLDGALLAAGAGSSPAQLCERLGIEPQADL